MKNSTPDQIRSFRKRFNSSMAALYYPWVEVAEAQTGSRVLIPPSGAVAGIYARNDLEHGVARAPANEVLRGVTALQTQIPKPVQETLNAEGVCSLVYFQGKGNLVWGARTMASDAEWKY